MNFSILILSMMIDGWLALSCRGLDPHLQKLAASAPMIAVWDDHEGRAQQHVAIAAANLAKMLKAPLCEPWPAPVANDDFKEGAENHHPQQGPFQALDELRAVCRFRSCFLKSLV